MSAAALIQRLPGPVYVSVTTLAGRETAEKVLSGVAAGIFFAPLDYISCVRRVLRALRPALVLVLETEIWPNLYRESRRSGARLMIANGRISDRRAERYRSMRWFFTAVLEQPHILYVQSESDRARYLATGAPPALVELGGNLKYDFTPREDIAPEIRALLDRNQPSKIWIAASTMPPLDADDVDEDDIVLSAFAELRKQHPKLLMILVPRRPERFDLAAQKLQAAGVPFVRRTGLRSSSSLELPGVLLLDTIGELAGLFSIASVVFMGGTLARRGGHNILEPAFFAKPVIVGPNMQNFAAIAADFREHCAMIEIAKPEELAAATDRALRDGGDVGARAREVAQRSRGAVDAIAKAAADHWNLSLSQPIPSLWRRIFLYPLSLLWRLGAHWNRRRRERKAKKLDRPVVSIGNLTAGGAGKTPVTRWLVEQLERSGRHPAILTRGYKRRSPAKMTIVAAGELASCEVTGDEAQMLVRDGHAHIGIAGDRYAAGQELTRRFRPDLFVMDDGLQHASLARDLDVVLVDALDPFGGGSILPLGRLREPVDLLGRAGAILITRVGPRIPLGGIEARIQTLNPRAPIFRARTVGGKFRPIGTQPPFTRVKVAAFCGLGNPATFFETLRELGVEICYRWRFGDHHHYRPHELQRFVRRALDAGAEAVVTTEKDMLNLPTGEPHQFAPLPAYWLPVRIEMDRPDEFLRLIP